jgi:hypothetical protein
MINKIKVLYFTDPVAFQLFGGAEVQMLKTKEHLEKMYDDICVKFFEFFMSFKSARIRLVQCC